MFVASDVFALGGAGGEGGGVELGEGALVEKGLGGEITPMARTWRTFSSSLQGRDCLTRSSKVHGRIFILLVIILFRRCVNLAQPGGTKRVSARVGGRRRNFRAGVIGRGRRWETRGRVAAGGSERCAGGFARREDAGIGWAEAEAPAVLVFDGEAVLADLADDAAGGRCDLPSWPVSALVMSPKARGGGAGGTPGAVGARLAGARPDWRRSSSRAARCLTSSLAAFHAPDPWMMPKRPSVARVSMVGFQSSPSKARRVDPTVTLAPVENAAPIKALAMGLAPCIKAAPASPANFPPIM